MSRDERSEPVVEEPPLTPTEQSEYEEWLEKVSRQWEEAGHDTREQDSSPLLRDDPKLGRVGFQKDNGVLLGRS
jgi:hypothetical protein